MAPTASCMRFIDIGANLLDEMYQGRYNDKEYHAPDLQSVLSRAWAAGVEKIIITAGSLEESRKALELAHTDERLFCTVGCHPTQCGQLDSHPRGAEGYVEELLDVLRQGMADGKAVAVGECGLDYDRLHFCDKEAQQRGFELQFRLARESQLPMFLHLRGACEDFMHIVRRHNSDFVGGVVHSFDGSQDEAREVLALQKLCIGLNGCSLKTDANLAVVASLPLDRLMVETDCPWCDIRSTHAGRPHVRSVVADAKDKKKHNPGLQVKGRNEPCNIRQVLEVVAGARGVALDGIEPLASAIFATTAAMFFPGTRHHQLQAAAPAADPPSLAG